MESIGIYTYLVSSKPLNVYTKTCKLHEAISWEDKTLTGKRLRRKNG